jgi:hypothetical protein
MNMLYSNKDVDWRSMPYQECEEKTADVSTTSGTLIP